MVESKELALPWNRHKTHCWKVRFKKEIECLAKDVLRDMTHITQSVCMQLMQENNIAISGSMRWKMLR